MKNLQKGLKFLYQKVVIDSFVKLKSVGGKGNIFIDEQSYINSGTVIYSGNGILIGKNVLIVANCTLAQSTMSLNLNIN